MRPPASGHGAALLAGLALALASCSNGAVTPRGGAGAAGQADAGGAAGASGSPGDAGHAHDAGADGAAGADASGTSVDAGEALDAIADVASEPIADSRVDTSTATPCAGAGDALHFADDLDGTKTKSTQVWADLGGDTPIGDAARTVEMWVYMEGSESWKSEHSLIEYGGTGRCQAFGIDSGDTGKNDPVELDPFTFSSGGPCTGDNNGSLVPQPPRTGWLHLAWVYDPAGTLAYGGQTGLNYLFTVDGVPQPIPAKKQTGALLTMKTLVSIGSGQITDDGFTGKIDELRIWNIARTAPQIADTYRLIITADEPGLVANYHFDEGTGTTVHDATSAHHDATFNTTANRPQPTWVASTNLVLTCAN